MSRRVIATALLAILTAGAALSGAAGQSESAASAEETTSLVTFYGHVFRHTRDEPVPMNTQFPWGEADYSLGSYHYCGIAAAPPSCEDDTENEVWFYSTAGFVQVKTREDFSYDKIHNERGLTKDTRLDTTKDITATIYMSADAHGFPTTACQAPHPGDVPWPVSCWNWDPGMLTNWQIEATLFTGVLGDHGGGATEAPDTQAAFEEGKLTVLAQGVSDPVNVQSLEPLGNPTAWQFDVNLGPAQRPVIPKEESYIVRFQWWSLRPDGSKQIMLGEIWNLNGGESFPVSITLPVKGAFNVEMVLPQFVYDKLVILGIMNTPWGSYDVDHDSIKLDIQRVDGTPVEARAITRLADFSVAHDGHYKPVNVTYVWDYKADGLAPGEYTATVSGANFQGSATASCTASFIVREGGVPGDITIGQCGTRTISDDQLGAIKDGSAQDAANTGGGREARLPVRLG